MGGGEESTQGAAGPQSLDEAEGVGAAVDRGMEFAHQDFKAEAGGATAEALEAELLATNKALMEAIVRKNDGLEGQMAQMIGPNGQEVLVFNESGGAAEADSRRIKYGASERMGPVLIDVRIAQLAFKDPKKPLVELNLAADEARRVSSTPEVPLERLRAVREDELLDWKASLDRAETDAKRRVLESRQKAVSVSKDALNFVSGGTNVPKPPPTSVVR